MAKDLYQILGVSKTADTDEIKKVYKKLARKLHPDVNPGDKESERKFKEINAAHAVLADKDKRKLYDEFGDLALQAGFDEARAKQFREGGVRGGPQGGGGFEGFDWTEAAGAGAGPSFEDLFGDLFGGGRGGRRAPRGPSPGDDVEANLDLDFMTAVKGGTTRLTLEKPTKCKICDGTGSEDKRRTTCPDCGGTGKKPGARGPIRVARPCPTCGGAGKVIAKPCGACGARGIVMGRETIDVNIPGGVREGQRLRLAGLGSPGEQGAPAGDLYVRMHLREHAFYKREGDDLHVDVPITVGEAVRGATIHFPTPAGEVDLKVPPGTQSGRRFRLRGLGVSTRNGKGDLYARAVVHVPQKDSPEAKELARKLDEFYDKDVRSELAL